jgi:DNA-binding NarL/FixJ family response regulator
MKTKSQRKPHIAALDPDPAILNYLHRILSDRFDVNLFTEAGELTSSLKESSETDLLLMDWHITEGGAGESSLELLMKLHASQPSLPIILLACSAEL